MGSGQCQVVHNKLGTTTGLPQHLMIRLQFINIKHTFGTCGSS